MTRPVPHGLAVVLPAALLVAVAGAQVTLTRVAALSPWKGGGFGMFASLDGSAFRYVRVYVAGPSGFEEVAMPAGGESAAARAALLPTLGALRHVARAVRRHERARGAPVHGVRVEVWRVAYSRSLLARDELVAAVTLDEAEAANDAP
jgi:hypothetical protein